MLQDNAGIESADIYEEFRDRVFADPDFEWPYADTPGDIENEASLRSWLIARGLDPELWFDRSGDSGASPHPYLSVRDRAPDPASARPSL
jgi:hypothetical protein